MSCCSSIGLEANDMPWSRGIGRHDFVHLRVAMGAGLATRCCTLPQMWRLASSQNCGVGGALGQRDTRALRKREPNFLSRASLRRHRPDHTQDDTRLLDLDLVVDGVTEIARTPYDAGEHVWTSR